MYKHIIKVSKYIDVKLLVNSIRKMSKMKFLGI